MQHIGITTSNLSRSVAFYTEVLGGVEVQDAGGDGWKGDSVYQLLMQAALIRGGVTASWAANLSAAGPDVLNARYVSLGNMMQVRAPRVARRRAHCPARRLELLDYRSDEAQLQRRVAAGAERQFPTFSESNVAPSVAANMHLSFNVRANHNLNALVTALEAESHQRGFANVFCNRLVPVTMGADGHPDVDGVPQRDNSYYVDSGGFRGWSLAYCKGPDGEQLEFNQVVLNAKQDFDQALQTYIAGGANPIWRR